MKRKLFPRIANLLVLILFLSFIAALSVYAQSGSGALPPVKPTPTPKGGKPAKPATPSAPAAPVTPTLDFGEELKGRLDTRASEKGASGSYFEEYILNARSEDLLTFRIESENQSLGLQILDKDKAEVAVAKDPATGEFKIKTSSGGLPSDGEYRLRVTGAPSGRNAIPFSLKVTRVGLTNAAYDQRFSKLYFAFKEDDAASVDETLSKFEGLAKDDPNRPTTFEMLGIIYLYNRHDVQKAEQAMEQAIKLKGAAVVKITYDSQWRRIARLRSGKFDWEDARAGWIRIRPGEIVLTDPTNKTLASLKGAQIKELSKIVTSTSFMVQITAENVRRPFIFAPGSKQSAEADLVVKLITNHVMGRTN
jgi:hypothetical protein